MRKLIESEREIPVEAECDILVAGGGMAGIAAGIAAARTSGFIYNPAKGLKIILVERESLLGGLATLGLITIYLPLCDGMGKQVSFGLAEELLRLSIKHGAEGRYPDAWLDNKSFEKRMVQRFEVQYNPHLFALEAERLLLSEGVEILYYSQICGVNIENNRISHIIIENKNGRSAIAVKTVVDATGDADICKLAGEKTINFSQKNVLASWYYYTKDGSAKLKMLGFADVPDKEKDMNTPKPLVSKRFTGLDDISDMLCVSHEKMLEDIIANKKENLSYSPVTVPTIPQVRMTRRIEGVNTIDDCDKQKPFSDSIGIISDWRKRGPVYEIPASVLYGNTLKNLITAGRCISVTDAMWDISRVIPACAVTGEAAGTIAAITDSFSDIDISLVQKELIRKNVAINICDL